MEDKLSKNRLKLIKSLQQKKYRDEHGLFLIEGVKIVEEALSSGAKVEIIIYEGDPADFPFELPANAYKVSAKELDQVSALKTPNRILGVCKKFPEPEMPGPEQPVLALDRISDPGNFGTIIRICDWFDIETVLCDFQTVDVYNPKVVQATMGSLFRVKAKYVDLHEVLKSEKENREIFCATMEGEPTYSTVFSENSIIVMGSESHGIRKRILDLASQQVSIPRFGQAESLNVAVATGIMLSEFKKKISQELR